MSYDPVIPTTGYSGWVYLQNTETSQREASSSTSKNQSDEEYFRENIGNVETAEDLVSDRRLLEIALGAFGLEDDINSTYLIQTVLAEGTSDSGSLANSLSDPAYAELSAAFGFDNPDGPATQTEGFADTILSAYEDRQFENAVTEENEPIGTALESERELTALAASDSSDTTKWYKILGDESLREVFEVAYGLPESFATLDLDKQVEMMRDKTEAMFGSSDVTEVFSEPENVETLIRNYLVKDQAMNGEISLSTPGAGALMMLQGDSETKTSTADLLTMLYQS